VVLTAICPLTRGVPQGGHGCCCGNYHDDFGWIYVTADDPWGFAEGIVHEMAHWKLRALGVQFEDWTDLLLKHQPTELYASPVRKDKPRPMGAVLHAQYSYVHVAEMVRRMYEAAPYPTPADASWLAIQLARIKEGQGTLRAHARGTPGVGDMFLEGLDFWTTEVLSTGALALPAEVSW
jgi:HEXXH motif-containing protein